MNPYAILYKPTLFVDQFGELRDAYQIKEWSFTRIRPPIQTIGWTTFQNGRPRKTSETLWQVIIHEKKHKQQKLFDTTPYENRKDHWR